MTITTNIRAIGSANSTIAEVESATKALRAVSYPDDLGEPTAMRRSGAAYGVATSFLVSNSVTNTKNPSGPIAAFRWSRTGFECRIRKVSASFALGATTPAGGLIQLEMYRGVFPIQYNLTTYGSGTNLNVKGLVPSALRTGMIQSTDVVPFPPSIEFATALRTTNQGADIVQADLTGATVAGGTSLTLKTDWSPAPSFDPNAIASISVSMTTVIGPPSLPYLLWDTSAGDYPLILNFDEGFSINCRTGGNLGAADVTSSASIGIVFEAFPLNEI